MARRGLKRFLLLALVGIWVTVLLAACPAHAFYLPVLIKDINPGAGNSNPENLTAVNDTLYFTANDGANGTELWKSNTSSGTIMVQDITPGPESSTLFELTNAGGTLFFFSYKFTHNGSDAIVRKFELFKSKDTETSSLGGPWDSISEWYFQFPPYLASAGDRVYFFAGLGESKGLWTSDGTIEGTALFKENLFTSRLGISLNAWFYFGGDDQSQTGSGTELWRTDGDALVRVSDLNPGSSDSDPTGFTLFNGEIYFSADAGSGRALWRTNGTASGTTMVPGTAGLSPSDLTPAGGVLFFTGENSAYGREMWVYEPSATNSGNVVMVKDIYTGPKNSNPASLTAVGDKLFFSANDFDSGIYRSLWVCNTTDGSTHKVRDRGPNNPNHLANVNDRLFFAAEDSSSGLEVWTSDGTKDGTKLVADVNPGAAGSNPMSLINVNGTLFFAANNVTTGRELYKLVEINRPDFREWIERELIGIPREYFKKGDRGLRTALVSIMREVNSLLSRGKLPQAIQKLHNVRRHVDGIGNNNWVTDPTTQKRLTDAIDGYIIALNGIK